MDKAEAFYDLLCDIIGEKLSNAEMLSKLLLLQINVSTKQSNHNVMVSKELSERGIALSTTIRLYIINLFISLNRQAISGIFIMLLILMMTDFL
jgi:Mn-containing catalase